MREEAKGVGSSEEEDMVVVDGEDDLVVETKLRKIDLSQRADPGSCR